MIKIIFAMIQHLFNEFLNLFNNQIDEILFSMASIELTDFLPMVFGLLLTTHITVYPVNFVENKVQFIN